MRKVLARRLMEEWLATLPPGSEFTARDVCENVSCYQGVQTREVTNYLKNTTGVSKAGKSGNYTRYIWEGRQ